MSNPNADGFGKRDVEIVFLNSVAIRPFVVLGIYYLDTKKGNLPTHPWEYG